VELSFNCQEDQTKIQTIQSETMFKCILGKFQMCNTPWPKVTTSRSDPTSKATLNIGRFWQSVLKEENEIIWPDSTKFVVNRQKLYCSYQNNKKVMQNSPQLIVLTIFFKPTSAKNWKNEWVVTMYPKFEILLSRAAKERGGEQAYLHQRNQTTAYTFAHHVWHSICSTGYPFR